MDRLVELRTLTLLCNRSLEPFHPAKLKLCTYWTTSPHLPSPSCWQPPFYFLSLWTWLLRWLISRILWDLSLATGSFHLAERPQRSCYSVQQGFPSRLNDIPLLYLPPLVYPLILCWTQVAWRTVCKHLFEILLLILLDIIPTCRMLGHISITCNFLRNLYPVFCSGYTSSHSH